MKKTGMKKIKTLLAVLMVFTMVLGLTACAGTNEADNKQESEAQSTSEENAAAAESEKAPADISTASEETADTAASNTEPANEINGN